MMANAFTAFFMLHRMNQPVMKGRCWHFMKEKRSFWIVGGDLRQIKLAELLLEDGHQVQTYAVEQRPEQGKLPGTDTLRGIEEADCVILPLPVMAEHGICLLYTSRRHRAVGVRRAPRVRRAGGHHRPC